MPKAKEVFNQRMLRARKEAGLSLATTAYRLRDALPERIAVSIETVRRLETGFTPEEAANPIVVATLAQVYGKPVAALSASAAQDVEQILSVLNTAREGGGLPIAQSRCTEQAQFEPRHLMLVRAS